MKRFLVLSACLLSCCAANAGVFERIKERREARHAKPETVTVKESTPVVVTTEKTYKLTGQKITVAPVKGGKDCPNCK